MTSVSPEPITTQPNSEKESLKTESDLPQVYLGLNALANTSKFYIHQFVKPLEVTRSIETRNRYRVLDGSGNFVFDVFERSTDFERGCYGAGRECVLSVFDEERTEVIRMARERKGCKGCSCCGCGPQWGEEMMVDAPAGQILGSVRQRWSPLRPSFGMMNNDADMVASVKGPFCVCQNTMCTGPVIFQIYSTEDSSVIGSVQKLYSGFARELYTKADDFELNVKENTSLQVKILSLCLVFLLDFMFFEDEASSPTNSHSQAAGS